MDDSIVNLISKESMNCFLKSKANLKKSSLKDYKVDIKQFVVWYEVIKDFISFENESITEIYEDYLRVTLELYVKTIRRKKQNVIMYLVAIHYPIYNTLILESKSGGRLITFDLSEFKIVNNIEESMGNGK